MDLPNGLSFHSGGVTLPLASRSLQRVQSLHEQTYETLRTAILSGELTAGDRLIETQLAEMLQVSRTPVREAIRQLQREHLVMADANGAIRVAELSVTDAAQLYDCRMALEQMAVVEACRRATPPQLVQLDQAIQQAEAAIAQPSHLISDHQLLHLDYQFHRLLAECSANPWLVSLLDQVFDKMALLRLRTLQQNPQVLEIRGEHRQIFQAVCDRDPQAATQAIQAHLSASKQRVIQEIQQLEHKADANGPI